MNSQSFSIDSIIGLKPKSGIDKETENQSDRSTKLELHEDEASEGTSDKDTSDVHQRRLKIPSYHTSTRDTVSSMHEATSTNTCYPTITCRSPHSTDNAKSDEHSVSSGDTCPNSCKAIPKQKRLSLTKHQLGELEKCFLKNYYPTEATREDLAVRLGLSHARVKVWFQNRRAKWQRNQKMKSEWQSFLHNPFTTALGLSHHRLMLQQHHQLLADAASRKEYDTQCLQTPLPSLYSPFTHRNMGFMLPRQDLMTYSMAKPSIQAIDAYMLANQATQHELNVKVCSSDDSDSEDASKSEQNTCSTSSSGTTPSALNLTEKQLGLPPGQFWW